MNQEDGDTSASDVEDIIVKPKRRTAWRNHRRGRDSVTKMPPQVGMNTNYIKRWDLPQRTDSQHLIEASSKMAQHQQLSVVYDPCAGVNCLHACLYYLLTGYKLTRKDEYAESTGFGYHPGYVRGYQRVLEMFAAYMPHDTIVGIYNEKGDIIYELHGAESSYIRSRADAKKADKPIEP